MISRRELENLVFRFQNRMIDLNCRNDAEQVYTTYDGTHAISGVMVYGRKLDCLSAAEHLRTTLHKLDAMDRD